jgi:hypothetical protein
MNQQTRNQYAMFIGIGLAVLLGVAAMAFLIGQVFSGPPPPTATPLPTVTPLPPPVVTIQGIKSQAKLSTVEQTAVAEIYNENLPEGWLDEVLGTKEQILILAYGEVRAGFDLEKLNEDSLWTDGHKVRLVLPAPEILNSSLNFDRTRIVYYNNNLLLDDNDPNLQGEALAQAKQAIEQAALEANILNQANDFGQLYYEKFLYSLGFTEVEVVVDAQIFKE